MGDVQFLNQNLSLSTPICLGENKPLSRCPSAAKYFRKRWPPSLLPGDSSFPNLIGIHPLSSERDINVGLRHFMKLAQTELVVTRSRRRQMGFSFIGKYRISTFYEKEVSSKERLVFSQRLTSKASKQRISYWTHAGTPKTLVSPDMSLNRIYNFNPLPKVANWVLRLSF